MKHTEHYQLSQFEGDDRIMKEDFNADNAKIDAALANAGNCKILAGSYVGNGKYGSSNPSSLTFPFEPKVIIMNAHNTNAYNSVCTYYIWVRGATICASNASGFNNTVDWSGNTVTWYASDAGRQFNDNGKTYQYIVFG